MRCGNGGPCRVFNTIELLHGGELGGLAGADAICQGKAEAAGLEGTYLAWLSAGSVSPVNRCSNLAKAGPYQLPPFPDGSPAPIVATDFAALASCVGVGAQCLLHAIDRSADSNTRVVENFPVWTGTLQNGGAATDSRGEWDGEGLGLIGEATVTDEHWTNSQAKDCELFAGSLYCFEQA